MKRCLRILFLIGIVFLLLAAVTGRSESVYDFCGKLDIQKVDKNTSASINTANFDSIKAKGLFQYSLHNKPSRIVFPISLPEITGDELLTLVFGCGLDEARCTDAAQVSFSVEVERDVLFEGYRDAPGFEIRTLDLTGYAGKTIECILGEFSTKPGKTCEACWIEPRIIRHSKDFAIKNPSGFPLPVKDEAEIILGEKDESRGIKRADNRDEGVSSFKRIDGKEFGTPGKTSPESWRMFYFDVDNKFLVSGNWSHIALTVEYLDSGTGEIALHYDSFDKNVQKVAGMEGAFKDAETTIVLNDTKQIKSHAFYIKDAWFGNSCNGADFRLISSVDFYVRRIKLSILYPELGISEEYKNKSRFKQQSVCLNETDPNSPRRSRLVDDEDAPSKVLRTDVDGDGDPDIVELFWSGKRARWFDENDDMKSNDMMGDCADDFVQIDLDGDGYYDGPSDMSVDWVDDDGDGDADLQIIGVNPGVHQTNMWGNSSHHMIFVDVDDDNVHGYVNWDTWDPFIGSCWRFTGTTNFSPDYNGDSIFLKVHLPPFAIQDPRYNWENPFAFYDFDKDGCTEMAIRFCDSPKKATEEENPLYSYDGKIEESYVTFDLDNDTRRHNEMDYDMTLRFSGGEELDYNAFKNPHPRMKAPSWVQSCMRYPEWRNIEELVYVPHDKCFGEIFKPKWGNCYLVFDEDDDDHRWERVELYYPGDPYITSRWGEKKGRGLPGHPQSDTLGDRGEFDEDFSGSGKLYIGGWDGKIHLYGAEWGAWLVDYGAKFWGSGPVTGGSSPKRAEKVEELIQYKDTNDNGFFDEITYDYDGNGEVDFKINILDFSTEKNPKPDVQPLIDPEKETWKGMHRIFLDISEKSWQDALYLYQAAWKKGLTDTECDDLAICSSANEKYEHAFWLKEKILRLILSRTDKEISKKILRLYFTGDMKSLADLIESLDIKLN